MFQGIVQSSFCSLKLKSHNSVPEFPCLTMSMYLSWLVICVFRRAPLCRPLLTMRSACAVVLALAAAALASADSDTHRPRHDSNLEICILLLLACRANARAASHLIVNLCLLMNTFLCFFFFFFFKNMIDGFTSEHSYEFCPCGECVCPLLTSSYIRQAAV